MKARKWWLEALIIRGAEGEGDQGQGGGDGGQGDPGNQGDQNQNDPDNSGDGDNGDGDGDEGEKETYSKEDVEKLRKALREERTQRRNLQKAQREAATQQQQDAQSKEAEAAAKELQQANERLARLAEGYRTSRVESAVLAEARVQKAVDPTDVYAALAARGFDGVDIEQDADDPTKVKVDADDLKEAVKAILKSKPHWVQVPGGGQPSGSTFPPGQPGRQQQLDDAQLKEDYPFLKHNR